MTCSRIFSKRQSSPSARATGILHVEERATPRRFALRQQTYSDPGRRFFRTLPDADSHRQDAKLRARGERLRRTEHSQLSCAWRCNGRSVRVGIVPLFQVYPVFVPLFSLNRSFPGLIGLLGVLPVRLLVRIFIWFLSAHGIAPQRAERNCSSTGPDRSCTAARCECSTTAWPGGPDFSAHGD
jgi:hypothetical protein